MIVGGAWQQRTAGGRLGGQRRSSPQGPMVLRQGGDALGRVPLPAGAVARRREGDTGAAAPAPALRPGPRGDPGQGARTRSADPWAGLRDSRTQIGDRRREGTAGTGRTPRASKEAPSTAA